MLDAKNPSLIDTVREIASDAQEIVLSLQPKVAQSAELAPAERSAIDRLVRKAEETMAEANKLAKARRRQHIEDLQGQIDNLNLTLATPGLDSGTSATIKDILRKRMAQLLRLQTQEGLDFGGILSADQVREIEQVLVQAKQDVAEKKQAAAFLGTLMQVTDIALRVVSRAATLV